MNNTQVKLQFKTHHSPLSLCDLDPPLQYPEHTIPGKHTSVFMKYNKAVGCGADPRAICAKEYITNGNFGNGLEGDETQWWIHPMDALKFAQVGLLYNSFSVSCSLSYA